VLTDRQIRALMRADIVVEAGDALRAKISDDYLLKALEEGGDFGQVLDQLASIGLDRISGTTSGLKMTAKMLADAMPMLNTETNTGGLVKVSAAAGTNFDVKKALTGIILTYENESELTFLPSSRKSLEDLGVKFEQAVVKSFGVAGSAGNSQLQPTVNVAIDQDIVFKAEDFLTQRGADGKDQKLTDLTLVKDSDTFTVRIKMNELASDSSNSVELSTANHIFDAVTNSGKDLNQFWGWNSPDGIPDAYQMYGWNAAPFERDWQRGWGGNDSNLPRFSLKYTDDIKKLVASADGEPLTFEFRGRKFDVEVDRGRMDFLNQPWGADGVTDATPYDSSDDASKDDGDFVVFRVLDDAAFEAAVVPILGTPIGPTDGFYDPVSFNNYWNWVSQLINDSKLSTKSVTSSELVTVTLDDITLSLEPNSNEYVVELTGAQLKAGSLVVTPNYGADGLDANGKPVLNISFEGGRAERTVLSFSSAINTTDWWRRGESDPVTQSDQREIKLSVDKLDLDGNGKVEAADKKTITFNTASWTFDTFSAMNDLANVLSGSRFGSTQSDIYHGIDSDEALTIDALKKFVKFSSDNGRLVVDYLNPGDQNANTLIFSEVGMANTSGIDQDGVDVVASDLYAASGTRRYLSVSATSKLTEGDKLKFTITNPTGGATATFEATITKELVAAAKNPIDLLQAAIKASLTSDLKFTGAGNQPVAIAKSGVTLTSANDAVLLTLGKSNYQIKVETTSEAGTFLVQQSSKDGAGGNVNTKISAVKYNKAPEVAYSTTEQELEGVFGSHSVELSSISVIDDSNTLQVTLSPNRGAHSGSFMFVDTSLFKEFLSNKALMVQYYDKDNKLVNAADKLPVGVNKLVISASAYTIQIPGGESITYKASDIVNLVLSGVSFQLNRGLYSTEDKYVTEFGLSINDEYTAATSGEILAGKFVSSGERLYKASITHGTLEDATGDRKIDGNDAIVKVSSLRQLATVTNQEDLDSGLHMTDNDLSGLSQGINDNLAASKVFSVTNKTLLHAFNSEIADMMVEQGLTSISAISLHVDTDLQYMPLSYAKAGFTTIYNETQNSMYLTASEANQLSSLGVGFVGDLEIAFESSKAETVVAPLRNLMSLSSWDTLSASDSIADYVIKNFGAGDKLDLKTFLKIDISKLSSNNVSDQDAAETSYQSASSVTGFDFSTNNLYYSITDTNSDNLIDVVDYYYVGWNQNNGEAATKAHFQVEIAGLNYSTTDSALSTKISGLLVA
jgi:hypothetical protein